MKIHTGKQRLFLRTQELTKNNSTLLSYGITKSCHISLRPPPSLGNTIGLIRVYESLPKSETVRKLVSDIQEGFNIGLIPKTTLEGTSGVYFLRNAVRKSTVKPHLLATTNHFDEGCV